MILSLIQKELEKHQYECVHLANGFDEYLNVVVGMDKKKRPFLLEIKAIELPAFSETPIDDIAKHPIRIQFYLTLPFTALDSSLNQVASLIHFINPYLDLPGFELNELKNQVSYRYVWMITNSTFDSILLMNIMGAIVLNLNLFTELIELLAKGELSFNDILLNLTELMK